MSRIGNVDQSTERPTLFRLPRSGTNTIVQDISSGRCAKREAQETEAATETGEDVRQGVLREEEQAPMRIYLAGRVTQRDWRHEMVPNLRDSVISIDDDWPELPFANGHTYVGPFFVACDHACFHGESTHGSLGSDPGGCNPLRPHDVDPALRSKIVMRCLAAIRMADLVFAWLEPEAYGTVAELGFAAALCPRPRIITQRSGQITDLWFAEELTERVYGDTPQEALLAVLGKVSSLSSNKCQSKIEERFMLALQERERTFRDAGVKLEQQWPVGNYRLDFAAIGTDKIAIEIDGHNYHERTKEQAQHDKSRDRYLVECGWRVLRFTGSEVFKDAAACVRQIERVAIP